MTATATGTEPQAAVPAAVPVEAVGAAKTSDKGAAATAGVPGRRLGGSRAVASALGVAGALVAAGSVVSFAARQIVAAGDSRLALDFVAPAGLAYSLDAVAAVAAYSLAARLLLALLALINFVVIVSLASLSTLINVWAIDNLGMQSSPLAQIELLPFIPGTLHMVENLLFIIVLSAGSNSVFASILVFVAALRGVTGWISFAVTVAAGSLFAIEWTQTIGRDGRQKISAS